MNALRPEAMNWTVPPLAVRALRREEGHCASRHLGCVRPRVRPRVRLRVRLRVGGAHLDSEIQ